ncbi:hypothetical protein G7083_09530 [Vibrio sp. HDW18]|uniref:DNA-binding protein n=1 Tax=Vibrio sp. HDW18 TaxID=2714948 RepID=UPI001407523E|nr:DNA-binding protein [Vibrio sp. HDW18]QIL86062.1 hypothetical protein G7083_09530 [Vibrio sp. HDW18]
MQTTNVSQQLEQILNQLTQQGKTPSVALVKARLTTPVPMPAIIAALKSWKNSQRIPSIEVAAPMPANLEQRVALLEQTLLQLSARVAELEARTQGAPV